MLKALVALGNPGPEYQLTRHNFGWLVADEVVRKTKVGSLGRTPAFELHGGRYRGTDIVICKPLTYMNRSGIAVSELLRKQRLDVEEMLVLYDDIDIDFGKIKLRRGGGDGGHKGIRSILDEIGQPQFYRLRLGIKPAEKPDDTPDYVLSPFPAEEEELLGKLIQIGARAAIDCLFSDPKLVMNSVNRTNLTPPPPEEAPEEK